MNLYRRNTDQVQNLTPLIYFNLQQLWFLKLLGPARGGGACIAIAIYMFDLDFAAALRGSVFQIPVHMIFFLAGIF